jgi:hypothetical protein
MGLVDQDDNIEILQGYFRQMQTMTVEASMDADLDLLTFTLSAHYFGVVMIDEHTEHTEILRHVWGAPEEDDSEALDDAELEVCDRIMSA